MSRAGLALLLAAACASVPKEASTPAPSLRVEGQPVPPRALLADAKNFEAGPGVVVLHYYGAGGWGIRWGHTYVLTAPYFSNHDLTSLTTSHATAWSPVPVVQVVPNSALVAAGFAGTPVGETSAILIGHGHIDHAGDVPAFFGPGLITGKPALIADRSTVNELAAMSSKFGCIAPIDDGDPEETAVCPIPGVRVTPIHHAHAPHVDVIGLEVAAFGGKVKEPRTSLPERADDYKLGNTWAYLIDLLDAQGRIAFRIHYVDAAGSPPHGIASKKVIAERDVDLHIACVPGFEQTDDYPGPLLERHHVKYVLMGHWEDFFQPRSAQLKPLRNVLDEAAMGRFVKIVERAVPEPRGVAPLTEPHGPHGKTWSLPVPGETFQFATAGHFD